MFANWYNARRTNLGLVENFEQSHYNISSIEPVRSRDMWPCHRKTITGVPKKSYRGTRKRGSTVASSVSRQRTTDPQSSETGTIRRLTRRRHPFESFRALTARALGSPLLHKNEPKIEKTVPRVVV